MSKNKLTFKIHPCISCFIKRTAMRFPCFTAYFLEVTSHWRTFYKIQRCILKMCRNFTYQVVGQRRRLKATIKNCTSKIKCQFIF
jgi:hypothetical protein